MSAAVLIMAVGFASAATGNFDLVVERVLITPDGLSVPGLTGILRLLSCR